MPSFLPKPPSPVLQRSDPLARKLVGAWLFHEGAGGSVRDLTQTSNGAIQGTLSWGASPFGAALTCNGSTDYVSVPHKSALSPTDLTVIIWFKATSLANAYTSLIAKLSTSSYQMLITSAGKLAIYTDFPVIDPCNVTISANAWTQAAFTLNFDTLTAYVNGAFDKSVANGHTFGTNNTGTLTFGQDLNSAGRLLAGSIGLVEIYNRALPAVEIAQKYQDPFRFYRPRSRLWEYATAAASSIVRRRTLGQRTGSRAA